jgi:hypothetical protein
MNSKRINRFVRISVKYLAWLITFCLVLYIVILIIFNLNENRIKEEILTRFSDIQSGELSISGLDLSWLADFPNISIILCDVAYDEKRSVTQLENSLPLARFEKFYVSINLPALLSGRIRFAELTFENGLIFITRFADSSVNLFKAIASPADPDSVEDTGSTPDLEVGEVIFRNIQFTFEDQLNGFHLNLLIKEFYNELIVGDNFIYMNLNPEIDIISIQSKGLDYLIGTSLNLSARLEMNLKDLTGTIKQSRLSVEGANLSIDGSFDLKKNIFIDLQISSAINDPSLLLLIFRDEIVQENLTNIVKGEIYLKGRITGELKDNIPTIELSFGISDLDFMVPNLNFVLRDLDLNGHFTTGEKQDLSDADFLIENISFIGRKGLVQGYLHVKNFLEPLIELSLNGQFEATGIEKVFKFIKTPIYSGIIDLQTNLQATLDYKKAKIRNQSGSLKLGMKNLSFLISNTGRICDSLSGNFRWLNDVFSIDSMQLKAGESDLTVTAETKNLINHFLRFDSEVEVRARIKSDVFDFNQFLTREDVGQWILDEYIQSTSGEFHFVSDSEKLNKKSELPPGFLEIHNLHLDLRNVADLTVKSGSVFIDPQKLLIKEFNAEIGSNKVHFSGEIDNYPDLFANRYFDKCHIALDLQSGKLTLDDFFTYKNENYLPDFLPENEFNDFDLDAVLTLPATMDSMATPEFDMSFDVKRLTALNRNSGVIVEKVRTNVTDTGNDLVFENINGKIGATTFEKSHLKLIDLFSDEKPTRFAGKLVSDLLDIEVWKQILLNGNSSAVEENQQTTVNDEKFDVYELPAVDVEIHTGKLQYKDNFLKNLRFSILNPEINHLYLDRSDSTWWLPDVNLTASIDSDTFKTHFFSLPQTNLSVQTVDGILEFNSANTGLFDARGEGRFWLDISKKNHSYKIEYDVHDFLIEVLLERLDQQKYMSGKVSLSVDLVLLEGDLSKLNGELEISGEDLNVYGMDIDEFLTRFKRTQNFNLVDFSAFLLAGPAGALVTKATDYVLLLNLDPKKQSVIRHFISSWSVNSGRIMARDVAFTTDLSRMALSGGFDLTKLTFVDFTLAVVDKKGCALISQGIKGSFDNPEMTSVNAVGTVLAPVTNVLKLLAGSECKPFYKGSLAHPSN